MADLAESIIDMGSFVRPGSTVTCAGLADVLLIVALTCPGPRTIIGLAGAMAMTTGASTSTGIPVGAAEKTGETQDVNASIEATWLMRIDVSRLKDYVLLRQTLLNDALQSQANPHRASMG